MISNIETKGLRTWIEISIKAIKNNLSVFRKQIKPKVKLLGVVKSNAYGHGLIGFSKILVNFGIDWLGVDSITEAVALRKNGIKIPILVLGYTLPANFLLADKNNVSLTISDFENLNWVTKKKFKFPIHLKIDSGMHRQGFQIKDFPKLKELLAKHRLKIQGIYTHFAAAKKPDTGNSTKNQLRKFKKALNLIKPLYPKIIVHASATAGVLNYLESQFNLVRVGIGLYGQWPSTETQKRWQNKVKLIPILTWKSVVSEIKNVEKGERVGYDYTEKLKKTSKLAVVPVGYWHGYWRAFSNKAKVLINGKFCKVVGRVSMDMIVADVSKVPNLKISQEVVLLGKQGKNFITADGLAKLAQTTNYEIITKLNPLIKKFYI